MPSPSRVPPASYLGAYANAGAFTDCYAVTVPGTVDLPSFVEAFYTTRLFTLERWLLGTLANYPSTDAQAQQLAKAERESFAAWRVESRSGTEILLNAGQTCSWLSVVPQSCASSSTTLPFGSAVVPMRPNGEFGVAFHALLGFHQLYSKLLLSAAAKRVVALRVAAISDARLFVFLLGKRLFVFRFPR